MTVKASNKIRHYHSKPSAQRVVDRLNRTHTGSFIFTVEQHPYDFGWGIKATDHIGRIAWVTVGPLSPLGFNSRGVA